MAWSNPQTWTAEQIVTKDDLNREVRDNLNETAPAKVTTKGDLVVASGANAIDRLAVGADNQVLAADSLQTLGVKWADPSSTHSHTPAGVGSTETERQGVDVSNNGGPCLDDPATSGFWILSLGGYDTDSDLSASRTPASATNGLVVVGALGYVFHNDPDGVLSGNVDLRIVKGGAEQAASTTTHTTVSGDGDPNDRFEAGGVTVTYFDQAPGASAQTYTVQPGRSTSGEWKLRIVGLTISVHEVKEGA